MADAKRKLNVNLPETNKGDEVEVAHLGVFKNGSTVNIDDSQVAYWEYETGRTWPSNGTLNLYEEAPVATETGTANAEESK